MKAEKRKINIKAFIVILVIIAVMIPICVYQNIHLVVTNYAYSNANLPEEFEGFRIVQLSDFHNATFGINNDGFIEMVRNTEPDIIVLTGDFVDSRRTNINLSVNVASELTDICPVYYVTGNHEKRFSDSKLESFLNRLTEVGVVVLNDEYINLTRGDSFVRLIGLDDDSLFDGTIYDINEEIQDGSINILLAHEPQLLDIYDDCDIDLVFTGHAHGGQIILPLVGPLVAPDQWLFPELTSGVHESDGTTMVISRGLGNSAFPVRVNNYPEIVVVTLSRE